MSVVTSAARRRWATVVAGVLLLGAVPPALAALPAEETAAGVEAEALAERVRRSDTVPHEGLAEVRGQLGLPSLPRLDAVTQLIDGTTRVRVWWAGPSRWRAATLTPDGERDTATGPRGTAVWDYGSSTTTYLLGDPAVRLPRADDLLPPQAARRLLSGLGPFDRLERIAPGRVAGRDAPGLRVVPANRRSSVEEVDIWVEPETALPLQMDVRAAGREEPVLTTTFRTLSLETPPPASTAVARPPGGKRRTSTTPDLASAVDRYSPWSLPEQLAGLPRSRDSEDGDNREDSDNRGGGRGPAGGAATYGVGLTRFLLLPLPGDVADEAITRARAIAPTTTVRGKRGGGEAIPLHRPLVSVLLARSADRSHAYLLTGTVRPEVLSDAVEELFAAPPAPRPDRAAR